MTLFGSSPPASLGNMVGSWIAYAVGYYGRIDLLEKNKLIHLSPNQLAWADDWFARYGNATVFFSRMLPISPHLHLAAGRRCEDAVLALHAPTRFSARSPGFSASRCSAKGSATTGKTGATISATSTTWCWRPSLGDRLR